MPDNDLICTLQNIKIYKYAAGVFSEYVGTDVYISGMNVKINTNVYISEDFYLVGLTYFNFVQDYFKFNVLTCDDTVSLQSTQVYDNYDYLFFQNSNTFTWVPYVPDYPACITITSYTWEAHSSTNMAKVTQPMPACAESPCRSIWYETLDVHTVRFRIYAVWQGASARWTPPTTTLRSNWFYIEILEPQIVNYVNSGTI